ncbi:DUF1574 family protein [Leptospira interrogans]|uniref:DUF1574 family protein n=1 Tax=Leptospira interrogans TaxID=173 RepID=UPI0007737DBA|nr:DUF1574 family protein [Leptospira interrogans]KAA1292742.1 DUF1574 domain-containing protein [Leptospira interrogans serovar Geyaweera]WOT13137.1 DUF1574 family protein [Leptospira interrogans]
MKKYKIQFLFLLFFAFDKVLLISEVRHSITSVLPGNPYIETLSDFEPKELEIKSKKKSLWNFGSSRSFGFYQLPVDQNTAVDPFLTSSQKSILGEYDVFAFATVGSNPAIYFTRFSQLLDRGYRPDLLTIELSSFSFNTNGRYTQSTIVEGIPLEFTIKHFNELPWDVIYDIWVSRLFTSYRYKLSMSVIKKKLAGTDKENPLFKQFGILTNETITKQLEAMRKGKVNRVYTQADFRDFPEDVTFSNEAETYVRYDLAAKVLDKEFYVNYSFNEDMFLFLKNMILKARTKNIPVVLWIPRAHPELHKVYQKYNLDRVFGSRMRTMASELNVPLIDLDQKTPIQCKYYQDISHISLRCFDEIIFQLISVNLAEPRKN